MIISGYVYIVQKCKIEFQSHVQDSINCNVCWTVRLQASNTQLEQQLLVILSSGPKWKVCIQSTGEISPSIHLCVVHLNIHLPLPHPWALSPFGPNLTQILHEIPRFKQNGKHLDTQILASETQIWNHEIQIWTSQIYRGNENTMRGAAKISSNPPAA